MEQLLKTRLVNAGLSAAHNLPAGSGCFVEKEIPPMASISHSSYQWTPFYLISMVRSWLWKRHFHPNIPHAANATRVSKGQITPLSPACWTCSRVHTVQCHASTAKCVSFPMLATFDMGQDSVPHGSLSGAFIHCQHISHVPSRNVFKGL